MLEVLRGITTINKQPIVVMDDLKELRPDMFEESGQMKWKIFEKDIRPNKFIYVRNDVNSLSFTMKTNTTEGCEVSDIIAVATRILENTNLNNQNLDSMVAIKHLRKALTCQLDAEK